MYSLLDMAQTSDPTARAIARDLKLLQELAWLMRTSPGNLLRQVSWSGGQKADTAFFVEGRPLSAVTRDRLLTLLNERLRLAEDTAEQCRQESARLIQVCLLFIFAAGTLLALLT